MLMLEPEAHAVQALEPYLVAYVPAGHAEQFATLVMPVFGEYVLSMHVLQTMSPWAEPYVPAPQALHAEDAAALW